MKSVVIAMMALAFAGCAPEDDLDFESLFMAEGEIRKAPSPFAADGGTDCDAPPPVSYSGECWTPTDWDPATTINISTCVVDGRTVVECPWDANLAAEQCYTALNIDKNGDGVYDPATDGTNLACCHKDGY